MPTLQEYYLLESLMRKCYLFLTVTFFLGVLDAHAQQPALPEFAVDSANITFSNSEPVEGEEITIYVRVDNIGNAAPTLNEDLVVKLYEGDPATNPLQILCKDVILSLEPGKSDDVKAQWRPPAGTTEIYAVVNPPGEKRIHESNWDDNITHTSITVTPVTFPHATPERIQAATQNGAKWLESQQGKHSRTCLQCGTENQLISTCVICGATLKGLPKDLVPGPAWDFGEDSKQETALVLQALFAAGLDQSRPSIAKGLEFFMDAKADWNDFTVYQYAAIVPVLIATDDDKYRQRAQFAINKLVATQLPLKGSGFEDLRDDGGWGYGYTADGAHTNMAVYALYAAKQWGLDVPQETWDRAEKWIRRNQTDTGGWLYNLVDDGSPWATGVYGSMTATGLWVLRACEVSTEDAQIRKGLDWIKKHWSVTRNPGSNLWLYYYLLSLQRFADIPPELTTLAGHSWYQEISNMLVARQEQDGRWTDEGGDSSATCFALMFLSHQLPKATRPNLGVAPRSLRFSPPSPRVGEPTRISLTLTNTGAPFDGIVRLHFYNNAPEVDGEKIAVQEAIFSPKLRETTVSINWAPQTEGARQIYAVVDPDNQIEDLNRENNADSQELTIYSKSTSATDPALAPPREIGEGLFQIGDVVYDVNKREVTLTGEINIINGDTIIEFFACGKLGKTHESVLMLDSEPIHIFLALGAELGMNPGLNLTVEGDPHTPRGDRAEIWVEWQQGGKVVRRRAEDLIWNAMEGRTMQRTNWVFTGGRLINNTQFTPQVHHNIIAVYRDPDSIFNHTHSGGTDDRTYRVNGDLIPAKGTKVKVIIHPIAEKVGGRRTGEPERRNGVLGEG